LVHAASPVVVPSKYESGETHIVDVPNTFPHLQRTGTETTLVVAEDGI
jgi:hypothetical protein